jgi:hypothetical protein
MNRECFPFVAVPEQEKRRNAMEIEIIDEAIDKYVHERLERNQKQASERFLSYLYLRYRKEDLPELLKKVGGLTRYYIDFLKVTGNPLKGPDMAWLASMIVVAVYAGMLISTGSQVLLGICVLAGTIVHGAALIRHIAKNWCETGVMIAIYREIIQLIDSEQLQDTVGH